MTKININCYDNYYNDFVVLNKNFYFALKYNINIIRIFYKFFSRREKIQKRL